ncbi:hypothetical protein BC829DRAFT_191926 [Chytridium lagenaria]|nr:hypothetical protein BC829DRAFT_191926 [Chytridium lagenaria]
MLIAALQCIKIVSVNVQEPNYLREKVHRLQQTMTSHSHPSVLIILFDNLDSIDQGSSIYSVLEAFFLNSMDHRISGGNGISILAISSVSNHKFAPSFFLETRGVRARLFNFSEAVKDNEMKLESIKSLPAEQVLLNSDAPKAFEGFFGFDEIKDSVEDILTAIRQVDRKDSREV